MKSRSLTLAALAGATLIVGGCGTDDSSSSTSTATSAATAATAANAGGRPAVGGGPGGTSYTDVALNSDGTGSGSANTEEVVKLTQAFLDTLDDGQKTTANLEFSNTLKRVTWSNFPTTFVARPGIQFSALNEEQRAAALAMFEVALSKEGYEEMVGIMQLDQSLLESSGNSDYGYDHYTVAIYGTPSTTSPFVLQIGGHHLARNLTYDGSDVSESPNFTGSEPLTAEVDGKTVAPTEDDADAMFGVFAGLDKTQLAAAELTEGSFDDVLMGPGQDSGTFPTTEGQLVSELSQKQQDLVTAAIRKWAGEVNEDAADAIVAKYVSEYDKTYVAWNGSIDKHNEAAYARIDGPSVWIEFSVQHAVESDGIHYHTVYRDKNNDYGSSSLAT